MSVSVLGKWRRQLKKDPARGIKAIELEYELPYPLAYRAIISQNGGTSGTEINVRSVKADFLMA